MLGPRRKYPQSSSAHTGNEVKTVISPLAAWSSGMILASGARGPGFNSRSSPLRASNYEQSLILSHCKHPSAPKIQESKRPAESTSSIRTTSGIRSPEQIINPGGEIHMRYTVPSARCGIRGRKATCLTLVQCPSFFPLLAHAPEDPVGVGTHIRDGITRQQRSHSSVG